MGRLSFFDNLPFFILNGLKLYVYRTDCNTNNTNGRYCYINSIWYSYPNRYNAVYQKSRCKVPESFHMLKREYLSSFCTRFLCFFITRTIIPVHILRLIYDKRQNKTANYHNIINNCYKNLRRCFWQKYTCKTG